MIKAPMTLISFSEEHADFEIYRDKDCHQLTQVNRFKGGCPVCLSEALPRDGKSDHGVPLVG